MPPNPQHLHGLVDLPTIKELLGHKTLTMTLRYAHLAPSHKVKAVSMLQDSLSGNQSIKKVYEYFLYLKLTFYPMATWQSMMRLFPFLMAQLFLSIVRLLWIRMQ